MPDLQQKVPGFRKFQKVGIFVPIAGNPDIIFLIDENAVLGVRSFVSLARPAPGLNQIPRLIELQHWRRWGTAVGGFVAKIVVVFIGRPWAMNHPDIVAGVDGNSGDLPQDPMIRQMLGPVRIGLELGQRRGGPRHAQNPRQEDASRYRRDCRAPHE
jgi:hypothetical protein